MTEELGVRRPLPTGTVTFMRTDIEGSMAMIRALGPAWDAINATHVAILRDVVKRNDGVVVRTEGDAVFAAFPEAGAAVRAAIDGQRRVDAEPWPDGGRIRLRIGLHSGEAHLAGDDYGGFDVNRAARIANVGHGGQIVASATTQALVAGSLPPEVTFRDLGQHALKDVPLPERLFQVDAPGRRTDFPALRVAGTAVGNVPERLTSFVGRAREMDELRELLGRGRLVTLTGSGGIGKTSLAIELARELAGTAPDGAWFVALDAVTDPRAVGAEIARTLGLFDGSARPAAEALPGFLAGRSMVLVLDNFEQVLDAAGEVSALLRVSPATRIIVTSRAPLRVAGEQEYPVHPLPVDGAGAAGAEAEAGDGGLAGASGDALDGPLGACTRLFVDRARAVRPGWEPGPDAALVTETCRLLDGLPLGIELAAARVAVLPVRAIRDRLAAHLPLPGSGPRDAPARQRTLEGAIEWSHDLLTTEEQHTLHDLGVFEGTFDADQAARVVGPADGGGGDDLDILDRLVSLAERSLLTRDTAPTGDEARLMGSGVRFSMLKTVQGFAAGKLVAEGRDADVRRRHARAYLELAEAAAPNMNTARQPAWLDRLTLDDANLRAALRWSIASGDVESSLRFAGAMWRYWLAGGRLAEGAERIAAVLAMPGADRPVPARVGALSAAGSIAYWSADRETSTHWYEEQRALAERLGDVPGLADAWFNLASSRFVGGDVGASSEAAAEAHRLYEELGDEVGIQRMEWGEANLMIQIEGPVATMPRLERNFERAVALGDAPYIGLAAGSLAWASYALGDVVPASRWALRSMLAYFGVRDVASCTVSLPVGAVMAVEVGRPHDAARIMGAFEALCERYGVRPPMALETIIEVANPMARIRRDLAPEEIAVALEEGRRMTLGQTMELVTSIGDTLPPESDESTG